MSLAPAACPDCRSAVALGDTVCLTCGLLLAPANAAVPPAAGGRFTVLRPIGQGGMGRLYLASDHSAFERPVVLKALLNPDALSATGWIIAMIVLATLVIGLLLFFARA